MSSSRSQERQPLLRPVSLETDEAEGDAPQLDPRTRLKAACLLPAIVMTYFVSYIVCHVEVGPFIYDKIAREYNGSHMSSERPCTANMSDPTGNSSARKIQNEIERRVATLEMYLGLTTFLTATLPVIFLGPLTDRYGRRLGFLFPITGTILKEIVYGFTIRLELPLNVLFLGNVFEALGGAFAAMLTTMFSVISDVTTPGKQRALHITIMEALQTMISSFAQIGVAVWIKSSFLQPLYLALGSGILSFLVALFFPVTHHAPLDLRDPGAGVRRGWADTGRDCLRLLKKCLKMPKKSVMLYVKDGHGRVCRRRLCLAVFILTVAVNFCKGGPWNLYRMKYPLCWSASFLLVFNGVQMVVNWVAILFLMYLFRKAFNMVDRHIAVLGCISSLMNLIFGSVATNDVMLYEVAVMGILIRAIIPMLRSMLSAEVDRYHQGALYAGLGVIETFGAGIFGLVANKLYAATLESFAGAVFLMFAGLMIVALILLIILNIMHSRRNVNLHPPINDAVQDIR